MNALVYVEEWNTIYLAKNTQFQPETYYHAITERNDNFVIFLCQIYGACPDLDCVISLYWYSGVEGTWEL